MKRALRLLLPDVMVNRSPLFQQHLGDGVGEGRAHPIPNVALDHRSPAVTSGDDQVSRLAGNRLLVGMSDEDQVNGLFDLGIDGQLYEGSILQKGSI